MNVNNIKNHTVRTAVINAIRNGRIRIAMNAKYSDTDTLETVARRDGFDGLDLRQVQRIKHLKVGDIRKEYRHGVIPDSLYPVDSALAERILKVIGCNAAAKRPFTTNAIVQNALEWCGKGDAVCNKEFKVGEIVKFWVFDKKATGKVFSVGPSNIEVKADKNGEIVSFPKKALAYWNAAPAAKVAKNGDWDNLATIYVDRAIEAEKQGNVHEAARYKERASELMKIMRSADTGDCNVWNVRLDENGNEVKAAPAMNASTSAKTRTFAECIDAELVNDGSSANKAEARQWLEMHRDDLMVRYGRDAYLEALERWSKQPDIQ